MSWKSDESEIFARVSTNTLNTYAVERDERKTARADSERLVLDDHTWRDLGIFESDGAEVCLFDFCNRTITGGGSRALRRRMENPWANAQRIRDVQASLTCILENRSAYDLLLPVLYGAGRVERYVESSLPMVTDLSPLGFSLGVCGLRIEHDRDYARISIGVHITCQLIRDLRRFVESEHLQNARGELAELLDEIASVLALPVFTRLPNRSLGGMWFWRTLRIDQNFRLHEKTSLDRLLELVHEVEVLTVMADVTQEHGFVFPQIADGTLRVHADGLVHPLIRDAVANSADLDQNRRLLFLTGPNMAGKTTYLRAFATAFYFAHLGMGVPARSFSFVPAQRLFSSISVNDDLCQGISYFRAEALRTKAVAQALAEGYRVVAIMDEPFKGTNVKDAMDASLAILSRLADRTDCLFMFSSHLIELAEELSSLGTVDCRYFEAEESGGRLQFNYVLQHGVSSQRLGMRVLQEEGIFDLLDNMNSSTGV